MLMAVYNYLILYAACVFVDSHASPDFECSLQAKVSAMNPHVTAEAPVTTRATHSSASVSQGGRVPRVI